MEKKHTRNLLHPFLLPFILILSLQTHLSTAADSLSRGDSLSGNQTLVSKGGNFELGFFTRGNSHNYYIGIWYKKIPIQTIIWVANRESPITNPTTSSFAISDNGNLVLLNPLKTVVWSSNSASKPAVATLLDTGNLVVLNGSREVWQSFAHPSNTWMPGGWLGVDKITGEYQSLNSWKNLDDPSPGFFDESMDQDGSNQYVFLWNGTKIYWTSGLWTGQYFSNNPVANNQQTLFNFTFSDQKDRKFATYTINDDSVITHFVIGSSGLGRQWLWMPKAQQWSPIFTQPVDQCDVYSLCGNFGLCDEQRSETDKCSCPTGFEPASPQEWDQLKDWSSGCIRKTQLRCSRNNNSSSQEQRVGFLGIPNVKLPVNAWSLMVSSSEDCEMACLNNCSCNAYAYDGGCLIWSKDLRDLRRLSAGSNNGGITIFVRLSDSDIPTSTYSSSHRVVIIATLSVVAGIFAIFCIVGCRIFYLRRKSKRLGKHTEGSLIRFSYGDLQRMTKNFTEKLGGGGFGSVYKGSMPDSTHIAVKRLEGITQGEKQFRAEVSTLGTIQHVNLLRLLGFCLESSKRLLVYEYMPQGSLRSRLFHDSSSKVLDWRTRYQIALGTARGLAYLHEHCRECIVHCDVKPDNILLDEEYVPKVADFGMAKLIGRDFSRVLTTMRGTIGYLAPEWISGLPITPKVDVYSFGMMLFEIVSGCRNTKHKLEFFPSWAARRVVDGNVEELLDPRLGGEADVVELGRVCKVACWCIQDSEDSRPSMGQVVQILEGALEVIAPPIPMALQNLAEDEVPVFYRLPSAAEDRDSVSRDDDRCEGVL